MAFFKKGTSAKAQSVESIGNVPLTAYDKAKAEWAERNGDATVNQARYFVIAAVVDVLPWSTWPIVPMFT